MNATAVCFLKTFELIHWPGHESGLPPGLNPSCLETWQVCCLSLLKHPECKLTLTHSLNQSGSTQWLEELVNTDRQGENRAAELKTCTRIWKCNSSLFSFFIFVCFVLHIFLSTFSSAWHIVGMQSTLWDKWVSVGSPTTVRAELDWVGRWLTPALLVRYMIVFCWSGGQRWTGEGAMYERRLTCANNIFFQV